MPETFEASCYQCPDRAGLLPPLSALFIICTNKFPVRVVTRVMRHLRPMVPPWLRWRSLFQPSVVLRVNIVRCRRRPFDKIRVIRWRAWHCHDGRIWAVSHSSVYDRVIRPERSIWHDPTVGEGNVSSRAVRHGGRGCEPTEEKKACGDHLLLQSPRSCFATLLHSGFQAASRSRKFFSKACEC